MEESNLEPKIDRKTVVNSLHAGADASLAVFFPSELDQSRIISEAQYSESDIQQISRLLQHFNESWSRVPRTYIVLRIIGQLQLLDTFINLGFNDFWFPITASTLPESLSPSVRARFVEAQSVILTKAIDLEKGGDGRHRNFAKGESIPFEHRGMLGSGGFSQVDKVLSLLSYKEYARKLIRRKRLFGQANDNVKTFMAELGVLKRLKHQHFVELVGSYTDHRYFGLIMSPVADADLAAFFTCLPTSPDKKPLLRSFFGCLSTALAYLHEQKIRHKDIKPENILIKGGTVLFTDFGISLDWTDQSRSTTEGPTALSPKYCPPEVANYEPRNSSSDIWSLGCVFLEMVTVLKGETLASMRAFFENNGLGTMQYRSNLEVARHWMVKLQTSSDSQPDNRPLQWIRMMLQQDHRVRPSARQLTKSITNPHPSDSLLGFCGICCLEDDESSDSDGTPYDDLWPNTSMPVATWNEKVGRETTPNRATPIQDTEPDTESTDSLVASSHSRFGNDGPGGLGGYTSSGPIGAGKKPQERQETGHAGHMEALMPLTLPESVLINPQPETLYSATSDHSTEDRTPVHLLQENGFDINWKNFDSTKAMLWASSKGYLAVLQLLLEKGSDVNAIGRDKLTALHETAAQGHGPAVQLLLEKGANVSAMDENGHTALHLAARHGREAVVRLLLGVMADRCVGLQEHKVLEVVELAAENGHEAVVWLLLEKKMVTYSEQVALGHALRAAAEGGREQVVQSLLQKGAPIDAVSPAGRTALLEAASKGRFAVVEVLLEKGADIEANTGYSGTSLNLAAQRGDEDMVRLLVEKGANIESRTNRQQTPLIDAARQGRKGAVQLLLDMGANIEAAQTSGGTALVEASETRELEVVRLLIEKGANVEARGSLGKTALYIAAEGGSKKLVRLLLENGADVEAENDYGQTALIIAADRGQEVIVRLLLESGADIRAMDDEGVTALHSAAGNERIFKLLLDNGADITARSEPHGDILQAAAAKRCMEVVRLLLLDLQVDINAIGGRHGSALHAAASSGDKKLVALLLENGADWRADIGIHGHVLQAAASSGDLQVVRLFLKMGADVNAVGGELGGALQAAAAGGFELVVRLLLNKGADINIEGGKYRNALNTAIASDSSNEEDKERMVRLLLQKGADIQAKGRHGRTALHEAASKGHLKVIRLLLKNGADIEAKNWIGTPLQKAADKGRVEVIRLLLENGADIEAESYRGTALSLGACGGGAKTVKVLLEKGANPDKVKLEKLAKKPRRRIKEKHFEKAKILIRLAQSRAEPSS